MYRWLEHTGELEIEIEARDERAVFEDAIRALAELMGEGRAGDDSACVEFEVTGRDRATLLAECLGELVYRGETERFVPVRLAELEFGTGRLRAVVEGYRDEPSALVKAITYHGLRFDREGDGWRAALVLDV
jgi:SHS2 domain-containing protein